jgi:hypothetical protein
MFIYLSFDVLVTATARTMTFARRASTNAHSERIAAPIDAS